MRILHLMIWTFGCALGIRVYQGLSPELAEEFWAFGQVYICVMGIAFGTIVTGAGVLAFRRWRGESRQALLPGHWLLLFGFAAAMANGVALGVSKALGPSDHSLSVFYTPFLMWFSPHGLGLIHQSVGWGLGSIAALAFLRHLRRRVPGPWIVVFFVFLGASTSLFLGYLFALINHSVALDNPGMEAWCEAWSLAWCKNSYHLYAALITLCVAAILLALVQDARRRSRTDWLHWTGIVTWLAIGIMQIAAYIRIRSI